MDQFYCVKCREKTLTERLKQIISKNNRNMVQGICTICGSKKSNIVSGKGLVNDLLNSGKLPELHLPNHNYTGPGTKLRERLLKGDVPINKLDKASQFHDMSYEIFKDTIDRHKFDKKLQKEAFQIAKSKDSTVKDKLEAGLVGSVMYGKRKLGLGVNS